MTFKVIESHTINAIINTAIIDNNYNDYTTIIDIIIFIIDNDYKFQECLILLLYDDKFLRCIIVVYSRESGPNLLIFRL
jgi:hypothetical protein